MINNLIFILIAYFVAHFGLKGQVEFKRLDSYGNYLIVTLLIAASYFLLNRIDATLALIILFIVIKIGKYLKQRYFAS